MPVFFTSFLVDVGQLVSAILPHRHPCLTLPRRMLCTPALAGSDKEYLRHLVSAVRAHLPHDLQLYTTDPPHAAAAGSLEGEDVLTTVDFGPGWFYPEADFEVQKSLNPPGKSPPMCSEFYTGEPRGCDSSPGMA